MKLRLWLALVLFVGTTETAFAQITNPVWIDEGPAPLTVTPSPSEPQKFYRVVAFQ